MVNEITYEQLEAYYKKRDLVIITSEVFYKMKPAWTWVKDPTQAFIEQRRAYEAKISKQHKEKPRRHSGRDGACVDILEGVMSVQNDNSR